MEEKKMERTKSKSNNWMAPIAADLLRVGMWPISKPISETIDPETGLSCRIYEYGSGEHAGKVIVYGKLSEVDRGTFFIIQALERNNGYEGIKGNLSDLVKMKGVKNPYQSGHINSIWDSVECLLDIHIRIKPNRRGGSLSTAFKLVTGWVDSDGTYFLTTHDYQKMVTSLKLYEMEIPGLEYFSFKSPFARSLREFLRTQTFSHSNKGYEISLEKLCKYIGYNPDGKSWWRVWPHIEGAMNDLKKDNFIASRSCRDTSRNKIEGGIIKFYPVKKKMEEISTGEKNNEIMDLIRKSFSDDTIRNDENSFRSVFNKTEKYLKEQNCNHSFKTYMDYYIDYLRDDVNVKYVSSSLFLPENTFFKKYEASKIDDGWFIVTDYGTHP